MTQGAGQGPGVAGVRDGGEGAVAGDAGEQAAPPMPPVPPVPPAHPAPSVPPAPATAPASGPAPETAPAPDALTVAGSGASAEPAAVADAGAEPGAEPGAVAESTAPPLPGEQPQHPPAPGEGESGSAPEEPGTDEDGGYTPTQRDLPVIGRAEDAVEPTLVDVPSPAAAPESDGPLFVVGDVHGYIDELRAALYEAGIIDADSHWAAGTTRIWFLGDFTDRGPDGIGVIDLVMQLSAEAAAAGGYCKALMGNHELLLLGAKRFGETPVVSGAGTASFQAAWLLNGGQRSDMERLEEHHIQWMSRLDAMALADGHLLLHSDASCYLDYGNTIEAVNDAITVALQRMDADETWDLFRKFTKRFAFRDEESGVDAAQELLGAFGGRRVVHGHSPIPYLLGEVGADNGQSEESPPHVTGPHVYADGLAIAMDGGVTMAGKLLVTQLPLDE